jgi:two-component system CheB/CheR fusion protein
MGDQEDTALEVDDLSPDGHLPSLNGQVPAADGDGEPALDGDGGPGVDGVDPAFEALLIFLRERRGFDFTGYKRPSLMRRVGRRMAELGIESTADYQDFLEVHPEEFTPLFNTVLINVTSFFRDRPAWEFLRDRLLPQVLESAGPTIRVWSAGCATGQEAYSLAIMLSEALGGDQFRQRVKIYATDVDEDALAFARQAVFSDRELAGLTPPQVEEYFQPEGGRFAFRKDLRRSVIFGRNDLVQDAPISHVDLMLCRNTLMYFNAEAQSRILGRLHFALNPEGMLFLGKAEMLLSHSQLFAPVDLTRRFFRRREAPNLADRRPVLLPSRDTLGAGEGELSRLRREAMLAAPLAQLALDSDGRVAMVNRAAERVLGVDGRDVGRPIQDLEVSYRPADLRTALAEARASGAPVQIRGVERRRPGREPDVFDVQVVPLYREDGAALGSTVIFEDVTESSRLRQELEYANRQLETAYEELQSTNEELETTNEELQSTVEELETTNEELQSTNEELETMNEELQSMNDELHVTNEELRTSTDEVAALNQFMSGVLGSFRLGVVVVDPELRVLAWNAAAQDLWGVREDEALGQHVLGLDIGLPVQDLQSLLLGQIVGAGEAYETVEVDAVNRRGRQIRVRVTVSAFQQSTGGRGGAVLLMDAVESAAR